MCPRCRQQAPLVYRGIAAYCAACGAPRAPLAASALQLAGQTSKVGGTVARVLGWVVLVVGLSIALGLATLALLIFTPLTAAAVGVPTALASLAFAMLLLRSGRGLQQMGTGEQKDARTKAIFALAQNRGGVTTAWDVAQALDMRLEEADGLLTELAKTMPDRVSLELDDAGGIYFRFPALMTGWPVRVDGAAAYASTEAPGVRQRVAEPAAAEAEFIEPEGPAARQRR
jgi:hypothetical protein